MNACLLSVLNCFGRLGRPLSLRARSLAGLRWRCALTHNGIHLRANGVVRVSATSARTIVAVDHGNE